MVSPADASAEGAGDAPSGRWAMAFRPRSLGLTVVPAAWFLSGPRPPRWVDARTQVRAPTGVPTGRVTLGQACPPGCQGAQCAFKDSMVH